MKLKVIKKSYIASCCQQSVCMGQCEAAKTLLAVMESRADSEMADRILLKMNQPTQLVGTHTTSCVVMTTHSWMCVHDCMMKTPVPRVGRTKRITGKMKKDLKP